MSDDPSIVNLDTAAMTLYPELGRQDLAKVGPKAPTPKERTESDELAKMFPKMAASLIRQKSHRQDFEKGARQVVDEAIAQEKAEREGRQPKAEPKDEKAADTEGLSEEAAELYSEVKLPDGMELDPDQAEGFAEVAGELGLGKSEVAALVKWDVERQAAMAEEFAKVKDETIGEWNEQLQKDFSEADLQLAVQTFGELATPELGELMAESGLGSHPAVVGLMVEVGKALKSGETGRITRALSRDSRNRR